MANNLTQLLQMAEQRQLLTPQLRANLEKATERGIIGAVTRNALGQAIKTSPLPIPSAREITVPLEGAGGIPMSVPESPPDYVVRAAESGVVFDEPASSGHFLQSLAFDRKNQVEAYRQALNKDVNREIDVRIGPASQEIEYFMPERQRYSLVKPPRAHIAEIQSLGGEGIVMGSEALAAGITAVATKSPNLVALGAGGGAVIGELMRLELGHRMGINQDIPSEEFIEQAAKVGAVAAGGGIAAEKLFQFGRLIHNLMRGRLLNEDLVATGIDMEDAIKIQNSINERLDDNQFRFNLAQASNDEDLLNLQDFFKRSREFSKEFGEFSEQQNTALNEFWKNINSPYRTRQTPTEVTEGVKGVAQAELARETAPADIFVETKKAELRRSLSSLTERPPEQLGSLLRDVGDREQQQFRNWAKSRAAELNSAVGNAEFIVNANTNQAVKDISKESGNLLFDSLRRTRAGLIGEAPEEPGEEATEELIQEFQDALPKIWNPDAKFTFQEAWLTVSALKELERKSAKGLSTDTPDVGTIKRLISALEADIDKSFGTSPASALYDEFKRSYAIQKDRLDAGAVGKLMQRRGGANGRFVLTDEEAFERLMVPGDVQAARDLNSLVQDDSEMLDAVREGFAEIYRRRVVKDGRINLNDHDTFMRAREGQLKQFFSKGEIKLIRERKGIESALRAREKNREEVLKRINNTFEAEIANIKDIDQITRIAMDTANPERSEKLVSMLNRTPDILRGVKARIREKMRDATVGPMRDGERAFSATRFNDFLNGKGQELGHRTNLGNVFGQEYVDNLDTLNQALIVAGREARFPNRSNTAFWADTVKNLTRAYVGLFTRPGRFLTALDRLRGRAANKAIVKAMLNPKDLEQLMSLQGQDLRSKQARVVLGALGATALYAGPKPGDLQFDSLAF